MTLATSSTLDQIIHICDHLPPLLPRAGQTAVDPEIDPEIAELLFRMWRLFHRHLRNKPFRVSPNLPRAEQWHRVRKHIKSQVYIHDVDDWLRVQVDVASNIANGIRDLRPRKNGDCHELLMEFVRDRKRKAHAVVHWAQAAENGHQLPSGGRPVNPLTDLYRVD